MNSANENRLSLYAGWKQDLFEEGTTRTRFECFISCSCIVETPCWSVNRYLVSILSASVSTCLHLSLHVVFAPRNTNSSAGKRKLWYSAIPGKIKSGFLLSSVTFCSSKRNAAFVKIVDKWCSKDFPALDLRLFKQEIPSLFRNIETTLVRSEVDIVCRNVPAESHFCGIDLGYRYIKYFCHTFFCIVLTSSLDTNVIRGTITELPHCLYAWISDTEEIIYLSGYPISLAHSLGVSRLGFSPSPRGIRISDPSL